MAHPHVGQHQAPGWVDVHERFGRRPQGHAKFTFCDYRYVEWSLVVLVRPARWCRRSRGDLASRNARQRRQDRRKCYVFMHLTVQSA
jgi:hypothetical protein